MPWGSWAKRSSPELMGAGLGSGPRKGSAGAGGGAAPGPRGDDGTRLRSGSVSPWECPR